MNRLLCLAASAALLLAPSSLQATVTITPSAGFNITWNSNDGAGFNSASVAPVPANLASAAGAAAFTSNDLGPQIGVPFHVAANLNDARYGNANSWIGGDGFAGAPFAGISLGGLYNLTGFAFGRDNGNGAFDDSAPGTDCCGGQLDDRSLGVYTLQFTTVTNPSAATAVTNNSATGWQTLGTLNYVSNDDAVPGGAFSSFFRHEYGLSAAGGLQATGLRLLVPATGLATGTAIDEIEIFGSAVPEPASALMACAGLGALALRRRRK